MLTHRYPHMVHEYYVRRLRDITQKRRERIAGLRTRSDAQRYVRYVRQRVRESFGPLPKKTPVNAVVTARDVHEHFDLERVFLESRPGFYLTGALYLPKGAAPSGKTPGVLGLCGHDLRGKACELYQSFSQGLAAKGFVVFTIDPIEQGERRQFYPEDGGKRPNLCHAHNLLGNRMALVDDFFGAWRVWDAIRGLDYLLSRPEVDTSRVGVTGNSGGGTLSTYLTAMDPRLTMAAPSCYVCSYLANMENELPSDSEQNPPHILEFGLDQADLLLCYAPRPTLILSQHDDFFDNRYTRKAHEDVRRVHELLGSHDSADLFVGPRAHGFFQENREAMYRFFLKHAGVRGNAREHHVKPLPERSLWATPRGQVRALGSRRVFDFTRHTAEVARKLRGAPSAARVRSAARDLLGIAECNSAPHHRSLYGYWDANDGLKMQRQFAVETEPGIQAIVTTYGKGHGLMHPPKGDVILYVGNTGGAEDVRDVPRIRKMSIGPRPFLAVDPRGMGQSLAKTCGSKGLFESYGSDFLYASTGEMLGENYLGRRVWDVLRTMDFLLAEGVTHIRLVGRGVGSVIVAFAGLLHRSKPDVRLINYLPSYELIVRTPVFAWPLSSLLRGCLLLFDLPDVYRALGGRLHRSEPWNAMMKPPRRKG